MTIDKRIKMRYAMKVRADGNSNICFARLCFTAGVQVSAARKPYKLSHGVRT